MNTKILSILMMLVIAAHVVSTSAVIASEKKRLQSQSASAQTDTEVLTPLEEIQRLFLTQRENEVVQNMEVYHTATTEFFTTETIFSKDGFVVPALAEQEKELIIDSDNGISVNEFTDAIFEEVKPVLTFKAFEKMKELVPFSVAQRTCLRDGECAQQLLHKITFLSESCYDNDNTVEDLKNKITERYYTLDLGSDMNSFSTNYVEEQQQEQLKPESDDEGNEGGAHHLYTLKNEVGWITLHHLLTGLFFGGSVTFPAWFISERKDPKNYEEFFNQLQEFMGIAAASGAMNDMASSIEMTAPMEMAFGCIGDNPGGQGCNNEAVFSTWRCALAGLNFNTPLVDMEVAEAARKVAQEEAREADRIAAEEEAAT